MGIDKKNLKASLGKVRRLILQALTAKGAKNAQRSAKHTASNFAFPLRPSRSLRLN
jgi:hypothetical protein